MQRKVVPRSLSVVPSFVYNYITSHYTSFIDDLCANYKDIISYTSLPPGGSVSNVQLDIILTEIVKNNIQNTIFTPFYDLIHNDNELRFVVTNDILYFISSMKDRNLYISTLIIMFIMYYKTLYDPNYFIKFDNHASFKLYCSQPDYVLYCLIGDKDIVTTGKIDLSASSLYGRFNKYHSKIQSLSDELRGKFETTDFKIACITGPLPKYEGFEKRLASAVDTGYLSTKPNGNSIILSKRGGASEYRTMRTPEDGVIYLNNFKKFCTDNNIKCYEPNRSDWYKNAPKNDIMVSNFTTSDGISLYYHLMRL